MVVRLRKAYCCFGDWTLDLRIVFEMSKLQTLHRSQISKDLCAMQANVAAAHESARLSG